MTAKTTLIQGLGGRRKACAVCQRTVPKGRNYGHWILPMHKHCARFMSVEWMHRDSLQQLISLIQQLAGQQEIFWDARTWPPSTVAVVEEAPPSNQPWAVEINIKISRRY